MKESIITMLEQLKTEIGYFKYNADSQENININFGLELATSIIDRKIAHIKQEIQS